MLEVPKRLRSVSFQSNEVKGALNSLFLFCIQSRSLSVLVCNFKKSSSKVKETARLCCGDCSSS